MISLRCWAEICSFAFVVINLLASSSAAMADTPNQRLTSTSWSLTHMATENGDDLAPVESSLVSVLRFHDDEWYKQQLKASFYPCTDSLEMMYHTTSGNSNLQKQPLQIKDMSATCPGCTTPQESVRSCWGGGEDDSVLAIAFVDALFDTTSYMVTDDGLTLQLSNQAEEVLLEFTSCQIMSELEGTSWYPTKIWTEEPPLNPLEFVDRHRVSARFSQCSLSASTGCNSFYAEYKTTVPENTITISGGSGTEAGCVDDGIMKVESAYVKSFGHVASYSLNEETDSLVMLDSNGEKAITFTRCKLAGLLEGRWLSGAAIRNRFWNVGGKKFWMQFGNDNRVSGVTLCGTAFEAKYTTDNGDLTFQLDSWPKVSCDLDDFEESFQHENALKFERQISEVLQEARAFEIAVCTDTLSILDNAGHRIVRFALEDMNKTLLDSSSSTLVGSFTSDDTDETLLDPAPSSAMADTPNQRLTSTSWSLMHMATENGDDLVPVESYLISVLRFHDDELDKQQLKASFYPCTDSLEMMYHTTSDNNKQNQPLRINSCPGCTTPQERVRRCWDDGGEYDSLLAINFVDSLFNTTSYMVTDDGLTLQLSNQAEEVLLEFTSCQIMSELEGTSWYPTKIWTEDPPLNPLEFVDSNSVSARFSQCSLRVSLGCNAFQAEYKTTEPENMITISNGGSTKMDCEDDGIMKVESTYLKSLSEVASYSLNEETDSLVMLDSNGEETITFTRCIPAELSDWGCNSSSTTLRLSSATVLMAMLFMWR